MQSKRQPRQPSASELQRTLAAFNQQYPLGTPVIVTDDFGYEHQSTVESVAWTLGRHSNVVKVKGFSGGYDIDRVKPIV